jgi:2-oxoglutarate dehydrogenase E2 component (dihydrolipoamide succinyltransferase)
MIVDVHVPGAGESITEAAIGNWLCHDGDYVERDQEIAEVETDKATLPLIAPEAGIISIHVKAGEIIQIGALACTIDTSAPGSARPLKYASVQEKPALETPKQTVLKSESRKIKVTPVARNVMAENKIDLESILQGLKKISRHEVEIVLQNQSASIPEGTYTFSDGRKAQRVPMSPLRRKLSKRLVAVKNETAMLTTFNEADMFAFLALRKDYQEAYQLKYHQKMGFMSFFSKVCVRALTEYPKVNSMIEADSILTPEFIDLSIAVQTEKGLVTPVIRNAHNMGIPELERAIGNLAEKARNYQLDLKDLSGGTFTITNGGVFGSMLSTPILNPPQAAVLGMHNIVERPVVFKGKISIRPVMYLALSYDHRIIDGRDSVGFLKRIRELIETPALLADGIGNWEKFLLEL